MSTCTHCASPITHTRIEKEEGVFCCEGCVRVYSILNQSDMSFYYQLLEASNSKAPKASKDPSFQEFAQSLSNPSTLESIGTWSSTLHEVELESMEIHCSACAWLLERILSQKDGLLHYRVDFTRGTLLLKYDSSIITLQDILVDCAAYGYPLFPVQKYGKKNILDKALLWKLAISAAAFANVMSFSLASYFGIAQGMTEQFERYFQWWSLLWNIPVVLYCAQPFYKKALSGIKAGYLHMDAPVSLGILLSFTLSLRQMYLGQHAFFDSVSGLVFFLLLGRWLTQHLERALSPDPRWFDSLLPEKVQCFTDEQLSWKPLQEVEAGEIVVVPRDTTIPLDATLKSSEAWVDTHLMTGESDLRKMGVGAWLEAGFKNTGAPIQIEVKHPFAKSGLQALQEQWNQLNQQRLVASAGEKIVPWFVGVVFLLALARFFLLLPEGIERALSEASVVLILSCPCALALARPLSYGVAMLRARKEGYLLRSGVVLDTLSKIDRVIFDKTGTLTWTELKLEKWKWISSEREDVLAALKVLCLSSQHPVARSTAKELFEKDSSAFVLLEHSEVVNVGLKASIWFPTDKQEHVLEYRSWDKALLPWTSSNPPRNVLVLDGEVLAAIWLQDQVKEEVPALIASLKKWGKEPFLLSGDLEHNVSHFAKQTGFENYKAECSPQEKLSVLQDLQEQGHSVLAIGDGLNDSLLLSGADCGVLMKGGAEVLSESSDVLYMGKNLLGLDSLLVLSQRANHAEVASYTISILYNVAVLTLAFQGYLAPLVAAVAMPFSSVSVALCALLWARMPNYSKTSSASS